MGVHIKTGLRYFSWKVVLGKGFRCDFASRRGFVKYGTYGSSPVPFIEFLYKLRVLGIVVAVVSRSPTGWRKLNELLPEGNVVIKFITYIIPVYFSCGGSIEDLFESLQVLS